MTNSFFQKVLLCAFIGVAIAGFVYFFRHVIQAGDDALNGKYRKPAAAAPSRR